MEGKGSRRGTRGVAVRKKVDKTGSQFSAPTLGAVGWDRVTVAALGRRASAQSPLLDTLDIPLFHRVGGKQAAGNMTGGVDGKGGLHSPNGQHLPLHHASPIHASDVKTPLLSTSNVDHSHGHHSPLATPLSK